MRILFFLIPLFLFASDFIIKYENLKPFYYKNQLINLKFKLLSPYKDVIFISNVDLNTTKINPYIYEVIAHFKANDINKTITIYANNSIEIINLNKLIKIKNLPTIKNFCGILANKLQIINPLASKYDSNQTILSFTIKCKNCNLNDFNLKKEENLTPISPTEATYYVIIPKNKKNIIFYYYNLLKNKYERIKIPIILKEETISTQSNINPNENNFFTPTNLFILSLIAISLIIFLIYQKIWLLIFPILLSGLILIQFLPKGEIILKKGTKVHILPTKNSTVFYIIKEEKRVKILNKRKNYVKIKINNKIGWVNESN